MALIFMFPKGCISGYTCESMAHDLRMGYAQHFASLPVFEVEKINAGEQLSKLRNEIAGVSGSLYSSSVVNRLRMDSRRSFFTFGDLTVAFNIEAGF